METTEINGRRYAKPEQIADSLHDFKTGTPVLVVGQNSLIEGEISSITYSDCRVSVWLYDSDTEPFVSLSSVLIDVTDGLPEVKRVGEDNWFVPQPAPATAA